MELSGNERSKWTYSFLIAPLEMIALTYSRLYLLI